MHPRPALATTTAGPTHVGLATVLGAGAHPRAVTGARDLPLGSLRTAVTLLVVAHHAALAYHPYAPPPAASLAGASPRWPAFPVVDAHRWAAADLFVGINDVFFMALMFFVSGMFAWPSLARRGPAAAARERLLRLGVPFAVSALLLTPLAYAATYLTIARATGATPSALDFAQQWTTLGWWPAGPAWFLWVLLAFGIGAAGLTAAVPGWGPAFGRVTERLAARPAVYAAALVAVSGTVYVPVAVAVGPNHWTTVGPLSAQTSRVLLYAVYFVAGIGAGAAGRRRGLLAPDGRLARRWAWWVTAAVAAAGAYRGVGHGVETALARGGTRADVSALQTLHALGFVLACAGATLALVAVFLRWARGTNAAWDNLGANAYGIYLLHYACVTWLQLALLGATLPGAAKAPLVWAGAVAASWALSAALRRVPHVARIV